ncbi:unnamed protein product [Mycena citricolor]|uniref:Capsule polysaccharide biosynthesis protein n=1 Tax=Mycena citricolor TaxID=2018698 RepID=A0AAD2HB00_9AGAR|nr:unnamed protein product [Mycena citricolor]
MPNPQNYPIPDGLYAIDPSHLDLRSDADIDHALLNPQPVTHTKNIWFFWHSGFATMPPHHKRTVRAWHRRFSRAGWVARVVDLAEDSPTHVKHYLDVTDPAVFPQAFRERTLSGTYAIQHNSDLVRFPLLVTHGGVYADVGMMQIGDLDRLWMETIGNAESPWEVLSYDFGSGARGLTNYFLGSLPGNPYFERCHRLLLKLWEGRTDTEGLYCHPLLAGVPMLGADGSLSFEENGITYGPEECSRMLTDYIIQGQVITAVLGLVDEAGGWDGPRYAQDHVYCIDFMVGAQLINQYTAWDGHLAFELMSLQMPGAGEEESAKQKQAREIVEGVLGRSFAVKLATGIIQRMMGETLGTLWKQNTGSDDIPGTYGHWIRHGMIYWNQKEIPPAVIFELRQPLRVGPLLVMFLAHSLMAPDVDVAFMDALGLSEWHAIRPGKPPLSLYVREITSVSATFILSSTFSSARFGPDDADPFLASLGLAAEDENEEDEREDDETDDSGSGEPKKTSIISEALAKGLSVNVNGTVWKGVYIRIDEKIDEAVIIIYGLMPGKKYDIDLGLVQGGQSNNIRRQVVTDDGDHSKSESDSSSESPLPTPSSSPGTASTTPPLAAPRPQFTLEDRRSQLQHTLTLMSTERDSLAVSLKAARRDAQKVDAALRSEIEILKRASEKNAAAEHRARQKVLALQEAAKRAQASTREMEELVRELETELPDLRTQRAEKEAVYARLKEDADKARRECERKAELERRRQDGMKGELTMLSHKMDKVQVKRDKLEGTVIPDLEDQLRDIELEIQHLESDPLAYPYSQDTADALDEADQLNAYNLQWTRQQQQQVPGILTRPSPIPIQRPGQPAPSSSFPQWSTAPRHQPAPRMMAQAPQRRSSLKSMFAETAAPSVTAASTLSSRAAPFEPARSRTGGGSAVWSAARSPGKW